MTSPGSLAVTEIPGTDHYGRRVAVQRYKGSGPSRAGDVFAVLVDVPGRPLANGRRLVDVVTFGTIECVTPARGSKRGTWTLHPTNDEPVTVDYLTRNGAALELVEMVERCAVSPAQVVDILDRTSNLHGALSPDTRARLVALIEAPTLATWTTARGIIVDGSSMVTLWQALLRFTHYADASGNPRLPTPAQVVEAIAGATEPSADELAAARALRAESEHDAAQMDADELAAAMDRHPSGADVAPAGPIPGSFHDPAATCCGRDAADCDCGPAAAELADLADRTAAAVAREEAAEARHAYTHARVVELAAALADAEEERRAAREEMAAARAAADALWSV